VIDQHFAERGRMGRLLGSIALNPKNIGIGIDEGTAIVVQRDTATVIGVSRVFVYGGRDVPDPGQVYRSLRAGDRYDLRDRRQVAERISRGQVR
jgi:cyanophycinase